MPKITVIAPAYNHEKYIIEAIDSVLNQTFQDFEIIAIDDCSTDRTFELLKSITDPRLRVLRNNKRSGVIVGSKKGFDLGTGEYVAWLTTDDVFEKDMLETLLEHMNNHLNSLGVFGYGKIMNENGILTNDCIGTAGIGLSRYEKLNKLFVGQNIFCAPAALIKRSAFSSTGYFKPYYRQLNDMEGWIRLLFLGELDIIDFPAMRFRLRDNNANTSATTEENMIRAGFDLISLLDHYLTNITEIDTFKKIFPVYSTNIDIIPELIPYHLAQCAAQVGDTKHSIWAAQTMHSVISQEIMFSHLKKFGFGYQEYFDWMGQLPLTIDFHNTDTKSQQIINLEKENHFLTNELAVQNEHLMVLQKDLRTLSKNFLIRLKDKLLGC